MNKIRSPKQNPEKSSESHRLKASTKQAPSENGNPKPRKRNNSLIPVELMMNTSGEAGREYAALATVFGVPEYVNSKIFWERQQERLTKTADHKNEVRLPVNEESLTKAHEISSYVNSVLDSVATFNPALGPTPQATKSFSLPKIPNVSKFNDILAEDDELIIPANPSSVIIPSSSQSHLSIKSDTLESNMNTTRPAFADDTSLNDTTYDTNFMLGPPTIFDFISLDDDERFIVWGPDPIVLSSSMATATTSTIDRPSSYATLYNSQYERPRLQGFSSNTTSTLNKNKPTQIQRNNRFGSIRLSDLRRSSRRSLYRLSSNDQEKSSNTGSFLFKKAFGIKRGNKIASNDTSSISSTLPEDIPKVIEAATIHKLIEKLTSTLDYTFMTDFFLTYRDFIQPQDLCQLLISRFIWALQNDEEKRRIVRIRTFVVLRHWLSNYFVHDFIGNCNLRKILVDFLNDLSRHPLVKSSPRDQRIIKTLKRVVRRLKKLYYVRSSAASRVQVISPPPPTQEQEHISEKVRAKLSQNVIRRKTAIRMDMGSDHHGNMAVQNTRHAPVRVVGSLNMRGSLIESNVDNPSRSQLRRYTSHTTSTGDRTETTPRSSIHRKHDKNVQDADSKTHSPSSIASTVSEDSLESDITAGITLPDEEFEQEDEFQSRQQSIATEHDEYDLHWLREQQETIEYFKTLNKQQANTGLSLDSDIPINSNSLTSPLPSQSGLHTLSENSGPSSPITPVEPQSAPNQMSRVSSERWCRRSSHGSNKRFSGVSPSLPDQVLKELNVDGVESPLGISRKLSEKSIERRKSEKNLQQQGKTIVDTDPILPEMPFLVEGRTKNSTAPSKNNAQKELSLTYEQNDFTAIPYEQTEDLTQEISKQKTLEAHRPFSKQKLTRAISKVFGQSQPQPLRGSKEKQDLIESSAVTPNVEPSEEKPSNDNESSQPQNHRFLSLVAEQLRVNMSGEEVAMECECAQCSNGKPSASSSCKRLSLQMLANERRHSFDLRRKRGASVDWSLQTFPTNDTQSTIQRPRSSKNGPVYLGQLDTRSIIESCANRGSNKPAIEKVYSDDDEHSTDSFTPSERSIPTDAQADSSRAGDISLTSDSNMLRSKIVELDIPPILASKIQEGDTSIAESIPRAIATKPSSEKSFIMFYRTSKLASQFCYIERDVLVKVGWEELIHCKWTKMDANGKIHTGDSHNDAHESRAGDINYTRQTEKRRAQEQGIEYVIQRFNMVCLWVSSEIVRTRNINDRVKLIEKFIRLAVKCKLYSNYATLVQILLGLQSPTVAHLEKTWSKVSVKYQKQLNKLTEFSSPMKNWKHIRDSMTEVAEEFGNSPAEVQVEMPGTTADKQRFKKTRVKMPFGGCIPFLGIYLSDLVFNSEKPRHLKPNSESRKIYNANTTKSMPVCLDQPLVNFRKYRVIATVIKRVLIFQGLAIRYSFDQDPDLKDKCRNLTVLDAAVIRELSVTLQ